MGMNALRKEEPKLKPKKNEEQNKRNHTVLVWNGRALWNGRRATLLPCRGLVLHAKHGWVALMGSCLLDLLG